MELPVERLREITREAFARDRDVNPDPVLMTLTDDEVKAFLLMATMLAARVEVPMADIVESLAERESQHGRFE